MVLLICHGLQATQNSKLKELLRYTDEILMEVRHTMVGLIQFLVLMQVSLE